MSVTLPTSPGPREATPRLRRFGVDLNPALGGPSLRVQRLGTRFAVDFVYPPMTKAQAEPIIGALLDADTAGDTLLARLPMGALASSLGTPLVNGAGQTGYSLVCDGFTAGVTIPAGTPFSFTAGSRTMLHMTRVAATANGSGQVTLPIGPLLRASPADNAALEFTNPKIEGHVDGREWPWTVTVEKHYLVSFTLLENA